MLHTFCKFLEYLLISFTELIEIHLNVNFFNIFVKNHSIFIWSVFFQSFDLVFLFDETRFLLNNKTIEFFKNTGSFSHVSFRFFVFAFLSFWRLIHIHWLENCLFTSCYFWKNFVNMSIVIMFFPTVDAIGHFIKLVYLVVFIIFPRLLLILRCF